MRGITFAVEADFVALSLDSVLETDGLLGGAAIAIGAEVVVVAAGTSLLVGRNCCTFGLAFDALRLLPPIPPPPLDSAMIRAFASNYLVLGRWRKVKVR